MRKKLATLGGAVAAAVTMAVATPVPAHADGGCNFQNFCAYSDDFGFTYQTPGSSGSWPSQVANKVDWVMNNGNPNAGPALVDIFFDTSNQGWGAYACIGWGTAWNLRSNTFHFTWHGHHGSDGLNQNVHDNAIAHHWVSAACGNNNDNF